MTAFLLATWTITLELAPWLLLGAIIAGVLHVGLPPGFVKRAFVGRRGVLKAVALGIPLPLCSCGVIPAGLGLKKDGASNGAAVGFLISTPQTGVDSVLVSASFLGWPFAIFKLVAAGITGLVGGWLTDAIGDAEPPSPAPSTSVAEAPPRTLGAAWTHAIEVLRSIWKWLLFGVLLSAFITTALPPSWLASIGGDDPLIALGMALLISIPLYVCATASVPIAAALVAGGLPAGAALVFLMAGPATNLTTLGAVYRTLGRKALSVYLGTIVVGSVALAYAFDALFPLSITAPHQHVHEASPLAQASAALLVGMMVWFASEDVRAWFTRRTAAAPSSASISVGVEGMTCQSCVRKLTRVLGEDARVKSVAVELEPGSATVEGKLGASALEALVRAAGFVPR
ncbi:MAG: permease [Nannocystaceae bacterium]|nr:permease [Nannocystaceae bacterium]